MWSRLCQPLERVPPVPRQGRRTARLACAGSNSSSNGSMQAAPQDAPSSSSQAAWCRPLSGCAATACGLGGSAAAQADPTTGGPPQLPPIVALGKFDALHRGHRALAAAAAELGGAPWMVSFSGMAEVLGWPARLPLVAPCDRARVLETWGPSCQGRAPRECAIPFAEVRSMSPEAFVELLAQELAAAGVVVGSNYRFGYRAAGNTELLQQLGPQHGMRVRVLGLVVSQARGGMAAEQQAAVAVERHARSAQQQQHSLQHGGMEQQQQQQQQHSAEQHSAEQRAADRQEAHEAVSSSRIRHALAAGDVADAALCLGRPYRLVASLADAAVSTLPEGAALRLPAAALLNQPPRPGRYEVRAVLTGADTRQELCPARQAALGLDEAGLTLHASGDLLAALPTGSQHLALDFLS